MAAAGPTVAGGGCSWLAGALAGSAVAGGGWLIEWSEGSCYDNKMSRVPGECWVCVHTLVSYASESSGGT
eukprot:COSAG01_NODE_36285_length_519_cov_6.857143_1_plen_69_part_01